MLSTTVNSLRRGCNVQVPVNKEPLEMNLIEVWQKAQPAIKEAVGQTSYDTWFSPLKVHVTGEDLLSIEAPDEFFKNWIDEHYNNIIARSLTGEAGKSIAFEFLVNTQLLSAPTQQRLSSLERTFNNNPKQTNLNPRFQFEHFVVGPSNRFAFAAAQAVANNPAKAYNPLFIYGPVGLGKTHLLQSITHEIRLKNPDLKICYISSEQFTNELINAIKHKSTESFRQKYRHVDVLLIDDIHFIAGKESTQEEFFHTFNALHDARKQIIICSDRPPKDIAHLEERLVSRFAWGLIADVQAPDFETRAAILRKKLELESVAVPDDVVLFIAEQIKTNIRELEGALIRVVAYAILEGKEVSLSIAKQVLKDLVIENQKVISVAVIQQQVAAYFKIPITDLKTKKRNKQVVLPRQVAMYLSRKLTTHSLPEIGLAFGGKDHTTILHAYKKLEKELENDLQLKKIIEDIGNLLII